MYQAICKFITLCHSFSITVNFYSKFQAVNAVTFQNWTQVYVIFLNNN
jgi:hypothetical protein